MLLVQIKNCVLNNLNDNLLSAKGLLFISANSLLFLWMSNQCFECVKTVLSQTLVGVSNHSSMGLYYYKIRIKNISRILIITFCSCSGPINCTNSWSYRLTVLCFWINDQALKAQSCLNNLKKICIKYCNT